MGRVYTWIYVFGLKLSKIKFNLTNLACFTQQTHSFSNKIHCDIKMRYSTTKWNMNAVIITSKLSTRATTQFKFFRIRKWIDGNIAVTGEVGLRICSFVKSYGERCIFPSSLRISYIWITIIFGKSFKMVNFSKKNSESKWYKRKTRVFEDFFCA